jgi:hypothetical protein
MAISKITNDGIGDIDELTVDTNTLVVDSTNNRVGIGTTSPLGHLEVKAAGFVASHISGDSTSETQLRFNTNTAARVSNQANTALIFDTNATERLRVLAGGGLTFNGDSAAANALDDYEEGTWTATTDQGTLFSSGSCKYVKIGSLVTVSGVVSQFSNRTSTATVAIRGLPFATGATDFAIGPTLSQYINATGDATAAYFGTNRSHILFYNMNQGTAYDLVKHADLNNSLANFHFTVTYRAA